MQASQYVEKGLPKRVGPFLSMSVIVSFLMVLGLSSSSVVFAQADDNEQAVLAINETIRNIHHAIKRNPDMIFFHTAELSSDAAGLYQIAFPDERAGFQLFISVYDPDDKSLEGKEMWPFPALGFTLVLEYEKEAPVTALKKIIIKESDDVSALQQALLPIKLSLEVDQDIYEPQETVTLEVTLKNDSDRGLRVKELGADTVQCVINGAEWTNTEAEPSGPRILKSQGGFTQKFRFDAPEFPGIMKITCTYALGFKGVKPSASLQIPVE